jgi:hypothetical protein
MNAALRDPRRHPIQAFHLRRRGAAPDVAMRAFVDDRIEVVASSLLLAELELVLRRPKRTRVEGRAPNGTSHASQVDEPPASPRGVCALTAAAGNAYVRTRILCR